jgi:hypothetical protein
MPYSLEIIWIALHFFWGPLFQKDHGKLVFTMLMTYSISGLPNTKKTGCQVWNTLKFKCVDVKFGVQEHNDDINISLNTILSPHYNA